MFADDMQTRHGFQRTFGWAIAATCMLALPGCLATKVVTVPVKVAYGAGKLAVKGTAAAARAVIPDDEDERDEDQASPQARQEPPEPPASR